MSDQTERAIIVHDAVGMILHVSRMHRRNIEKRVGPPGLHNGQHRILKFLSMREEPCSQREIAEAFDISAAAVARSLKTLTADDYIAREGDAADARRNNVTLTEKGAAAVEETRLRFDAFDAEVFADMSDEEIIALTGLLGKLKNTLTGMENNEGSDLD